MKRAKEPDHNKIKLRILLVLTIVLLILVVYLLSNIFQTRKMIKLQTIQTLALQKVFEEEPKESIFEEIITDYIAVLDNICTDGVTSGNIHDNLVIYKETASQLSGQIDAALGIASRICTDFVSDIDEADGALY